MLPRSSLLSWIKLWLSSPSPLRAPCEVDPQVISEQPTHGPEDYAICFMVPPPLCQSSYSTLLDPIDALLREDIDQLYEFAQYLCLELEGMHYLADGCHALMMDQFHVLSVKFNFLKDEQEINKHLIPFTNGIISSLSILTGEDSWVHQEGLCSCGGCPPSAEHQQFKLPTAPLLSGNHPQYPIFPLFHHSP